MSSHDECARHAREMALRRQEEMRRYIPPQFGPAVDDVLWSRVRPGEEDESPQTPILGILNFTLKSGIDIRDESKTPRRLWDVALRYISSIPGCCAVEWGSQLDSPPSGPTPVFCLVHWDSTAAWRSFQHSLGFTPIVGLLASDASNRCAKLGASGAPRLGNDDRGGTTIVDVVSVALDAEEDGSSPERRAAFEERWHTLVASVTRGYDGLQHSYAVWLENNASTFADPTPADVAAVTKLAVFTAFLAWDGAHYNSHPVEELCNRLRAALPGASPANRPPDISRKAFRLIREIPQQELQHDAPQPPAAPRHNSLASILEADIPRHCSADLASLREHAQQALTRSISDARAKTRLFPAARGSFTSQGELYEGNMPVIPQWRRTPDASHPGYHFVDVVWMQLKARAPKAQGPRIYNQLKDEMGALPGFVKAFWARDVDDKAKIAVLTVWEDQQPRAAAFRDYNRILDDFAASSVHLAARLTHQALLMPRGSDGPWLDQWRLHQYLELICFHIPPGQLERQLVESSYAAFADMTEPSLQAGIPTACTVIRDAGGWQHPAEEEEEATDMDNSSSSFQLFTGVLTWASPEARQEWYEELFRLSCWSYEMFGQKLDALKILAAEGVEARFIQVQREYQV